MTCCCGGLFSANQTPFSMPQGSAGEQGGTTMVDLSINGLDYAGFAAGASVAGMTPLKMSIEQTACLLGGCCTGNCCFIIPHGFAAFSTSMLAGPVPLEEGCYCSATMPLTSVQYVVPLHTFVFDAPSLPVPTKDNITIYMNASVTWQVIAKVEGKEDSGIQAFATAFPAAEVNNKFRAFMQEAVRGLGMSIPHSEAYDLQGRDCKTEAEEMDSKFQIDGIRVLSFIIQEVRLPDDTVHRMQEDTMAAVNKQENSVKQAAHEVLNKNADELKLKRQEADINQNLAESEAQREQAGIQVKTAAISAETEHLVQTMQAQCNREVDANTNDAELKAEELKSKAEIIKREVETKLAVELNDLEQAGRQYKVDKETELASRVAQDKAEAADLVAKSEREGSSALALQRKFEQDKAQLEVFAKLVENRKLRIASTAEVNARGMTFNDDRASQFVHSAMRFFHTKFTDTTFGPAQEPLLKG